MTALRLSPRPRSASSWLVAALAFALGCATVPPLPGREAGLVLTEEALAHAGRLYLWPDRLDQRMVIGALDALEQRFDSVLFSAVEGAVEGVLEVSGERVRVPLDPGFDPSIYRSVLARALEFTAQHLREPIDGDDDLEHIALRGALGALDPYTTVFSGKGSEDFKIRFEGRLSGIGARIGRRDGDLIAVRVFPGSPADKGGLRDGDAILFIDGDPTRPLSVEEAVGRIRGRSGTPLALGLARGSEKERLEIEITRGEVMIPSVESKRLEGKRRIGYAQIYQVSRETAQEFRARVAELGPLDGLVIDMRGNTGGSMDAAAQLTDDFLDSQLIVRTVTRDGIATDGRSRRIADPGVAFDLPLVILVDAQTASAAEIISGALQPLGDVTLLGQRTFGKGLVQQVLPMKDQNLLKLTVAEYLLSDDRAINEKGIDPDQALFPVSQARLGALANVPPGAIPYVRATGEEDAFPIEAAATLLREPPEPALAEVRKRAYAEIAAQLGKLGVPWSAQRGPADAPLVKPLEISAQSATLVSGESGALQVTVHNPNDFDLPDVWLALDAPAAYLDNKLAGLGNLPAGGSAKAELTLVPPDGISVGRHPIEVLVAAGDRPLAKQRVLLDVTSRPPQIEIEVERLSADEVRVALSNKSAHAAREITLAVPGATRALETLEPGAREELNLPLSAEPKTVVVAMLGPWAQRRIEVPIPAARTTYTPPEVALDDRGVELGLHAKEPGGLAVGWIAVDGQKQSISHFEGKTEGALAIPLTAGDHDVITKVETSGGVSVIDLRHLTRE